MVISIITVLHTILLVMGIIAVGICIYNAWREKKRLDAEEVCNADLDETLSHIDADVQYIRDGIDKLLSQIEAKTQPVANKPVNKQKTTVKGA
jgi:hypothetical protein